MFGLTRKKYGLGVDAGATKTRCLLLDAHGGERPVVLNHSEVPAEGWTKSRIADPRAVARSITSAVKLALVDRRLSACSVACGIGSQYVITQSMESSFEMRKQREVSSRDVQEVIRGVRVSLAHNDRSGLFLLSEEWSVDGIGVDDPLGKAASALRANVCIVTTKTNELEDLSTMLRKEARLKVGQLEFEALAGSHAVLSANERQEGVIVVDIGAQCSGLAVWQDDTVIKACGLPIGGDLFTRDVSSVLRIPFQEAETLKLRYGSTIPSTTPEEVTTAGVEDGFQKKVPLSRLAEILEARAKEFVRYLRAELKQPAGRFVGPPPEYDGGVVLVGGGARLRGLSELIEEMLGRPVRIGTPRNFEGLPDGVNDPSWSVAAGLACRSFWRQPDATRSSKHLAENTDLTRVGAIDDSLRSD